MPSMRTIASLCALIPLLAVGIFLRDTPNPATPPTSADTGSPPLAPPGSSTNPTNRAAASLGITDLKALQRFNAKRDAKDFAHSYNIATRLGVTQLIAEHSPRKALALLVRGVPGEGEMVHSFRELNPLEIDAAASLVTFKDGRMTPLPEAEFTGLEKELKARALSCKYGVCSDCIADVRTNRLKNAREKTAALP